MLVFVCFLFFFHPSAQRIVDPRLNIKCNLLYEIHLMCLLPWSIKWACLSDSVIPCIRWTFLLVCYQQFLIQPTVLLMLDCAVVTWALLNGRPAILCGFRFVVIRGWVLLFLIECSLLKPIDEGGFSKYFVNS